MTDKGMEKAFRVTKEKLEKNYNRRNMVPKTLKEAHYLIAISYVLLKGRDPHSLKADEIRALFVSAEVLDYFNKFDVYLGHYGIPESRFDKHIGEGEIISWLKRTAIVLIGDDRDSTTDKEPSKEGILLSLERMRLYAAVYLNELYRNSKDIRVPLNKLIDYGESYLKPLIKDADLKVVYFDNMTYCWFLSGKAARQQGDFLLSELHFDQSTSCCLDLINMYSDARAGITIYDGSPLDEVEAKVKRVGVIQLAKSWLYLGWGKISKATLALERARSLLSDKDAYSKNLAIAIQGIIKRIGAKKDSKDLKDAISSLEKSYSFFDEQEVPRHAARCLFELGIALIFANKLKEAVSKLEEITRKMKRKPYDKLVTNPYWNSQIHSLCSRIARKLYNTDLERSEWRECFDKLKNIAGILGDELSDMESDDSVKGLKRYCSDSEIRCINLAIWCANQSVNIITKDHDRNPTKNPYGDIDAFIVLGEAHLYAAIALTRKSPAGSEGMPALLPPGLDIYVRHHLKEAENYIRKSLDINTANDGVKDNSNDDLTALCHVYLARIAIYRYEPEKAEEELKNYRVVDSIEYEWVKELASRVERQLEGIKKDYIVIKCSRDSTLDDLKDSFWEALYLKYDMGNRKPRDVARELRCNPSTIYKRVKARKP